MLIRNQRTLDPVAMSGTGTTPPEVDQLDFSGIYDKQVKERTRSNGSSFSGQYDTPYRPPHRASNSSLHNGWQQQQPQQTPQSNPHSRQNSFPLDHQPTLIATAPGRRVSAQDQQIYQNGGPQAFMGYAPQETPDNYNNNVYAEPPAQFDQYLNYDNSNNGTPQQPQQAIYAPSTPFQQYNTSNYASTSSAEPQSYPQNWGDQFLQDANNLGQAGNHMSGEYSGNVPNPQGLGQSGFENATDLSFEASLAEMYVMINVEMPIRTDPQDSICQCFASTHTSAR